MTNRPRKGVEVFIPNMSRIEWICVDCFFNMGQYCDNEKFSHNYENCQSCDGYEEDDDPEAHQMDDPDDPEDMDSMYEYRVNH